MITTRDFTFADGLTHGLVGPNGIGKTTLLRKIAGQIQSGGITVFGEKPFDNQSVLNRVILMGIDNPLPDSWGIGKLGVIGKARWPRWDEERFNELLVRFDVPAKAYSALSRGQKSAVGFIFAVASGCEVMLLDEPYLGLDTQRRELFYQVLREEHGRELGTMVLPVGGGGLLGGCGAWLRERCPSTRIVGVEPAGAVSMAAAVRAGRPVALHEMDRFVDGAAVRRVGAGPLRMVQAIGPELVAVDEGAVCTQMLELYQVEGIIAEPAGALAATAVATGVIEGLARAGEDGGDVVVVVSGGNNDVSRYTEVVERSLVHEGLKHYFLVTFPQEPGALRRFLDRVLGPDDDIVLFDYIKRNNREEGPALVGLEIGHREDLEPLMARMAASNMEIERIDPHDPIYRYLT